MGVDHMGVDQAGMGKQSGTDIHVLVCGVADWYEEGSGRMGHRFKTFTSCVQQYDDMII